MKFQLVNFRLQFSQRSSHQLIEAGTFQNRPGSCGNVR